MKYITVVPGVSLATVDMVVRVRFRERIERAGFDCDDFVNDVIVKLLRGRHSASAYDPMRGSPITYVEMVVMSVFTEQLAAKLRLLHKQRRAAAVDPTGPLSDATRGTDEPELPEPTPAPIPIADLVVAHGSVQLVASALGRSRWWVYRELRRQGYGMLVGDPGTNQHARRGEQCSPRRRRRSRSTAPACV